MILTDNQARLVATIPVALKRDPHLAGCSLAKSDPDATLACAYCKRAKWMHATRHDTCGSFRWVTVDSITTQQIESLRCLEDLPLEVRKACSYALNDFGIAPRGQVLDGKRTCAAAINCARAQVVAEI